jgi:hypothetical protein
MMEMGHTLDHMRLLLEKYDIVDDTAAKGTLRSKAPHIRKTFELISSQNAATREYFRPSYLGPARIQTRIFCDDVKLYSSVDL